MPSGKTHDRITYWLCPIIWVGTFYLTSKQQLSWLVAGGFLFSGLMFGPDLDTHSIQFNRWGVLRWLWLPYQKCIPHRSLLSHGPIIGTAVRIFYVWTIISIFSVITGTIANLICHCLMNWREELTKIIQEVAISDPIALALGLELGAMSHYLSDWSVSKWKNHFAKKVKKSTKKVASRNKIRKQ
jgi:uncharacterized metal-binding protein